MIGRLAIIGVGLIGGSLARALRKAGAVGEIVGCGRGLDNLDRALELGVIDSYDTHIAAAARGADMVLVAVPMGAMQAVFERLREVLDERAVITDAGSAKVSVLRAAQAAFGCLPKNLVPGHPIAGTEKSGVQASFDTLFQGRKVILTPHAETDQAALGAVREMWLNTGAEVVEMDAQHHDEVLAATSHLPHVLAYALVDMLGNMSERREIFAYAAGGFRDFTRIASSDPGMWHDIAMANREALTEVVKHFHQDLGRLAVALQAGDGDALRAVFTRAKALRDRFEVN